MSLAARHGMVLFNPGPVNLAEEVKAAVFAVELCHRQPQFAELDERVRAGLFQAAGLSPSKHRLSLLHGSGTLAVDAALSTLVRGRVMVLDNGLYCRRLARTLQGFNGADPLVHQLGLGEAVDLAALEAHVSDSRPDWIAVVHHETTTGLLNPLADIAGIAQRNHARLFVDAVSSLGAHALDPRCDVICFNSNKCLESLPGIAGVFWRSDLTGHPTVPVLDVTRYVDSMPSTPHVQAYLALDVALARLALEDRPHRYERLARAVWLHGAQHFEPFLPEPHRSHVLTAFRLGDHDFESLMARALAHDFVIYAGQEQLRTEIFRVANMGAVIDEQVIAELFEVLAA